jgi:hypothetical protein
MIDQRSLKPGSLCVMTKVATVWGLVLVMALHAVCHGSGLFLRRSGPIRHWAMTNGTLDAGLLMMHLVREIYESRKFVDPHPGNDFPVNSETLQGPDRGAVLLDCLMTAHAERYTRKSRHISGSGDPVARAALSWVGSPARKAEPRPPRPSKPPMRVVSPS